MRWYVSKELMVTPSDVMMYCVHCECRYLKILSIVIVSQPFTFLNTLFSLP